MEFCCLCHKFLPKYDPYRVVVRDYGDPQKERLAHSYCLMESKRKEMRDDLSPRANYLRLRPASTRQ